MQPKAILLDWDGTIIDGFPTLCRAMNETLVKFGKEPWDQATLDVQISRPDTVKFPEFFGEQSAEAMAYYYRQLDEIGEKIDKPKLIPGAERFMRHLQELRAKGVYVGIVTNSRTHAVQRELRQLGWSDYVDVIVASDTENLTKKKPDPQPYGFAMAGCPNGDKILPSQVLYVGDADTDLQFARNTGMKFLGITDKFTLPMEPGEKMTGLDAITRRLKLAERFGEPDRQ